MDNNPSSPLDTLRQLKEMLDSGALTPAEFEALKQRLVLNAGTPLPPPAAPAAEPPVVLSAPPAGEQHSPMFEDVAADEPTAIAPAAPTFSAAGPAQPAATVPPAPFAAVPELQPEPAPKWTGHEFPALEEAPARNPLALILSIGGVLVFLAVVAYLTLNRPPSEHISSTSQTAADSVSTDIETGPQAGPLPQTAAAPETIRVAPAHPAAPLLSRAEMEAKANAVRDSGQTAVSLGATDSAVSH